MNEPNFLNLSKKNYSETFGIQQQTRNNYHSFQMHTKYTNFAYMYKYL
jgi:hypothetical protein